MEEKGIHTIHSRAGTTLVELILFVSITAMMTGVVLSFSLLSTQVGMRTEVMADVQHAGTFATDYISQKVRASDEVDVAGGDLTLTTGGIETVYSLEDGKLRETDYASGDFSYITPENVRIDNLNFVLLGETESNKDGVTISFDIANSNPGGVLKIPAHNLSFHMTVAGRGSIWSSSSSSSSS